VISNRGRIESHFIGMAPRANVPWPDLTGAEVRPKRRAACMKKNQPTASEMYSSLFKDRLQSQYKWSSDGVED